MSIYTKWGLWLLFLIVISVAFYFGNKVPFSEQMPIYDGLRNTSAIIFAVMGAWLALIYPSKLEKAFGKSSAEYEPEELEQINRLFKPMIYSTVVLMVVITMAFIVPLAKQVPVLVENKCLFRALSFSMIGGLTFLQFWSLILTLIPGDSIKDDIEGRNRRKEMIDRMAPKNRKTK